MPAEAGFALICEVDGSRAEARAQRDALIELLGDGALAVHQPAGRARAVALARRRQPGGDRGARRKVSEDVVFPLDRLLEGLERFERIATAHALRSCAWGHGGDGNVHATVLVDPANEAELDAAEAVGEQLFALVVELGGSVAGEHGVGWLKRGRRSPSGTAGRSSCTSRSSTRSTPRACSTQGRSWRGTLRAR